METILYLHGMKFTSEIWIEIVAAEVTADVGYRCVAVDMPGTVMIQIKLCLTCNMYTEETSKTLLKKKKKKKPLCVIITTLHILLKRGTMGCST